MKHNLDHFEIQELAGLEATMQESLTKACRTQNREDRVKAGKDVSAFTKRFKYLTWLEGYSLRHFRREEFSDSSLDRFVLTLAIGNTIIGELEYLQYRDAHSNGSNIEASHNYQALRDALSSSSDSYQEIFRCMHEYAKGDLFTLLSNTFDLIEQNYPIDLKQQINMGLNSRLVGNAFKVIELTKSRDHDWDIREPTYFKLHTSLGNYCFSVHAPTVISSQKEEVSYSPRITIDAYAPVVVLGCGTIEATLRDNAAFEGGAGNLDITLSPHLDVHLLRCHEAFINENQQVQRVHKIGAPETAKGTVSVKDFSNELYLQQDYNLVGR